MVSREMDRRYLQFDIKVEEEGVRGGRWRDTPVRSWKLGHRDLTLIGRDEEDWVKMTIEVVVKDCT